MMFDENAFQQRVHKALGVVKLILDNTRKPTHASDVHHDYDDKYNLSEFLGKIEIAAHVTVLQHIGVAAKDLQQMRDWAQTSKRSVTLRLRAEESCKFIKKISKDVESDTKHVTKGGILGKIESFTVKKVTEYIWEYTVKWELVAFPGVDADKGIVLQTRTSTVELKTANENPSPKPSSAVKDPIDVNITWLLQNIDATSKPTFSINRSDKLCRTPRRNPEVERALDFTKSYFNWAAQVNNYFFNHVFPSQPEQARFDLAILKDDRNLFVPVLPLFESSPSAPSKIPPDYFNSFLAEQQRSLEERRGMLTKTFPAKDSANLISSQEAILLVGLLHANYVSEAYNAAVEYIENMLYKQFVAAIGKVVTSVDFANYLDFHYRKMYAEHYRPQSFSYDIRRPLHSPEGTLSITAQMSDGTMPLPISTIVSHSAATTPMGFNINESTRISFFGDRYLHGFVSHQFSSVAGFSLSLEARARQFSSFILMVGRIVSATTFDPKYAILIQNKDDLKIPLILETIPTPKEFKDAIASLSPEQQRFCKAFRSMQLESTLFGVCIVQIKPQLEKVLRLPEDSLTKEIQLSQELLSLFLKYQIPTDLVSYDGPAESSVEAKVAKVKEYVGRMHTMIDTAKKGELDEAQMKQQMRLAQLGPVQISVKTLTGKVVAIDIELSDTIETLKSKFYALEGVPPSQQRMIYKGEQLENHRTLADYNVTPGAIIHLVLRLRGGPGEEGGAGGIGGFAEFQSHRTPSSNKAMNGSAISNLITPTTTTTTATTTAASPRGSRSRKGSFSLALSSSSPSSLATTSEPAKSTVEQVSARESRPTPQDPPKQEVVSRKDLEVGKPSASTGAVDYTKIPVEMEKRFDEFDENNALRPTIINTGPTWNLSYQKTLLSGPASKTIDVKEQEKERNKAFDLLDALTKSGALPIDYASLHVLIASTHCFDKTIIDTVIQDNVNPIEKIENSSLIVASTIHQTSPLNLIAPDQVERITATTSRLLLTSDRNANV